MVEGVGRVGAGDLELEQHAIPLLEDRHEYAIRVRVPKQGDGDAVVVSLIKFANHGGLGS
jgi:hypothetical protein